MRANLAGWQERLDPLVAQWADGPPAPRSNLEPAVAFSPDGKLVAIGAGDRMIQLRKRRGRKADRRADRLLDRKCGRGFQPAMVKLWRSLAATANLDSGMSAAAVLFPAGLTGSSESTRSLTLTTANSWPREAKMAS